VRGRWRNPIDAVDVDNGNGIALSRLHLLLHTMKFSSAAIIVLSALHSANALVSGPRPHSVSVRPSLQSSKLFSSAAASSHLSVGNSVGLGLNNDAAASSTGIAAAAVSAEESYNLNYGPGK
jgi:hypothetical protein